MGLTLVMINIWLETLQTKVKKKERKMTIVYVDINSELSPVMRQIRTCVIGKQDKMTGKL